MIGFTRALKWSILMHNFIWTKVTPRRTHLMFGGSPRLCSEVPTNRTDARFAWDMGWKLTSIYHRISDLLRPLKRLKLLKREKAEKKAKRQVSPLCVCVWCVWLYIWPVSVVASCVCVCVCVGARGYVTEFFTLAPFSLHTFTKKKLEKHCPHSEKEKIKKYHFFIDWKENWD